jgi:hypothetical protein
MLFPARYYRDPLKVQRINDTIEEIVIKLAKNQDCSELIEELESIREKEKKIDTKPEVPDVRWQEHYAEVKGREILTNKRSLEWTKKTLHTIVDLINEQLMSNQASGNEHINLKWKLQEKLEIFQEELKNNQ